MEHFAISAHRDGFRRAGRAWNRQATVVAAADLTAGQLAALHADPNIAVTPCPPAGLPPASADGAGPPPLEEALRGLPPAALRRWLIRAAFDRLDADDPDHFTAAGAPEIAAVRRLTGLASIAAAERDALWREHRAAGGGAAEAAG